MKFRNLLITSVILHILAAWFSVGRFHADEQFQVLEFAAYKTGVNPPEELPWEFHEKIRPALQVMFAFGLIKASQFVGITNPFVQAFILRLIFSLFALFVTLLLLKKVQAFIDRKNLWFLYILSMFWCFVPWFHARFSSENVGITFFLLGALPFFDIKGQGSERFNLSYSRFFLLFFIIGLAGVIRFQLNFLTIGLVLWMLFVKRVEIVKLLAGGAGIVAANGLGVLCDKWLYGKWEFTTWNYFYQNLVLHKAEQFGKEPFYYYFEKTITDVLPPFSILVVLAVIYFVIVYRRSSIAWMITVFLLAHFFTAHKELRFLFPLIPFIPILVVLSYQRLVTTSGAGARTKLSKTITYLKWPFYIANFGLLAYLSFKPADDYTPTLRFLYGYNESPTVLYYEKAEFNPYSNEVSLRFYRTNAVTTKLLDEEEMTKRVEQKQPVLYITDSSAPVFRKGVRVKMVYSTLPQWLKPFNFNNWQERTHPLYIYEVYL